MIKIKITHSLKKINCTIYFLLIPAHMCFSQSGALGRVRISSGTVVTDKGTLLRGAYVSTDWYSSLPSHQEIKGIKAYGLNAIHLYAECGNYQYAGECVDKVDSIVKWTEQDSLYLILTIGNCNSTEIDYKFTMDFWKFYAPRYKDKKHVIYEIRNEPPFSIPFPDTAIALERNAYQIIRENAPETHVILFSHGNLLNWKKVIDDINNLGATIDWSNASIGFHNYIMSPDDVDSSIVFLRNTGCPIMSTEMPMIMPINWESILEFRLIKIFEKYGISYLLFMRPSEIMKDSNYKDIIEDYNISWIPDFGKWPFSVNPNGRIWNAKEQIEAEFFDKEGGDNPNGVVNWPSNPSYAGMIDNNDWIMFEKLDFRNGCNYFEINVGSPTKNGKIELYLNSLNSKKIGECSYNSTGSWETWKTFGCQIETVEGIQSIYLKFIGGEMNLNWFKFSNITEIVKILDKNEFFQVFPNPFHNLIYINYMIKNEGIVDVSIYNSIGKRVANLAHSQYIQGEYHIQANLNFLENGIYIVKIISGDYCNVEKILKY